MERKHSVRENIITICFAALIFVGIRILRIPLPFSDGTSFLHCGYIFMVMAVFCLDLVKALAAGLAGFLLFHVLNGEYSAIPGILFIISVSCLSTGTLYEVWMDQDDFTFKEEYKVAVKCVLVYGALILLVNLAWMSWSNLMGGCKAAEAVAATFASSLPVVINAVVTIVIAILLYPLFCPLCRKIIKYR